jgi:hypothetical protein
MSFPTLKSSCEGGQAAVSELAATTRHEKTLVLFFFLSPSFFLSSILFISFLKGRPVKKKGKKGALAGLFRRSTALA